MFALVFSAILHLTWTEGTNGLFPDSESEDYEELQRQMRDREGLKEGAVDSRVSIL